MNPLRALYLSLSRIPIPIMLVIIAGLGIFVAMLVTNQVSEKQKEIDTQKAAIEAQKSAKSPVVYATKDIPEGATISQDAVEERQVESGKVPADSLGSASMAVGRVAKYGIPAQQVVSAHDLAMSGGSIGFESKIKEGYRAVTFAVDNNSGVAGFVAPGSHVDIVATAGSAEKTKVGPILSDVEVVAVGQVYQKASGVTAAVPASSVTVALTPEDAKKLIKGIKAGNLYLTLRNDKDHAPVPVIDVTSLFEKPALSSLPPPSALPPPPMPGEPNMAPMAPPPPPMHEIEQWTGSKKEMITVPKS